MLFGLTAKKKKKKKKMYKDENLEFQTNTWKTNSKYPAPCTILNFVIFNK
jgi:hypothetical protein